MGSSSRGAAPSRATSSRSAERQRLERPSLWDGPNQPDTQLGEPRHCSSSGPRSDLGSAAAWLSDAESGQDPEQRGLRLFE